MKVMIVEDDMLVRLGVKSMIPWAELGLEVVGEARDGVEALELFEKYLPDLALVDIGLPKLSGLEFIEQAKAIHHDCEYIILTCNQDFDMVRQSLRLDVRDFILKSTMEIETLKQVIEDVVDLMNKRREERTAGGRDARNQSFKRIQKKDFLRDWLNGIYTRSEAIAKKAEENGITVQGMGLQAWVIQLDTPIRNGQKLLPHDVDKLGYAVENIANELYRERLIGFVEDVRTRRWHILVDQTFNKVDPRDLLQAVDHYLGYAISIGCSRSFTDLTHWSRSEAEASDCLQLKYYQPHRKMFESVDLRDGWQLFFSAHIASIEKEIYRSLSLFQFEQVDISLHALEQALVTPPFVIPGMTRNLLMDISNRIYGLYGDRAPHHRTPDELAINSVLELPALRDSLKVIKEDIRMLLSHLGESRAKAEKRRMIEEVESQIHENPYLEMNLNEIADYLKVSPAYLSKIFKEETGSNFTDFVLDIKVQKAVKMMENGMGVTETAERLGYLNVSSFTRMFKKRVGVAPSHFVR